MTLPPRLKKQPLLESVLEVRFKSSDKPVADLLPGIVFSRLSNEYKRLELLPPASIPKQFRNQDPNLQNLATHRISGDDAVVFFGDGVLGLAKPHPYQGWKDFRGRIQRFVDVVRESGVINEIDRFSMKSVNVIPSGQNQQLGKLTLDVKIAGKPVSDTGFSLRTEINDASYQRIVEVMPNVVAQTGAGAQYTGLRLTIDCIRLCPASKKGWEDLSNGLDAIHDDQKRLFFELLTPDTLASLEPEYE